MSKPTLHKPEDPTIQPPVSKFDCWISPALMMLYTLVYVPSAIYAVLTGKSKSFSGTYFSKLWPDIAEQIDPYCATEKHYVAAGCQGIVIEVGPGLGHTIKNLDKEKVQRVYAIEPNKELVKDLRKRADELGWGGDRYIILNCGIENEEELRKAGVPIDHGVDSVLCIQVLCTIPNPQSVLRDIYNYLKPGGELRIFEHVQSHDKATQRVQAFYDYLWHIPFDGCHLSRPTPKWLVDPEFMGFQQGEGWEKTELEKVKGESRWEPFPNVWGRLVKRA